MKERIVIEGEYYIQHFKQTDNDYYEHTIEKQPETFEELKELCKQLDKKLVKENNLYETQITMETDKGYYAFYQDGTIIFKASNSINYTVAENRTMSQIFQFIKSLVGENK